MTATDVARALGGAPVLLEAAPADEREDLVRLLDRGYLNGPLPQRAVAGVLFFLSQTTRRRSPMMIHGAMLLETGVPFEVAEAWLRLSGWEDPGPLVARWRRAPRLDVMPEDPRNDAGLLARSMVCSALNPGLSTELHRTAVDRLAPSLQRGWRLLLELWSGLHAFYCGRDELPAEMDPLVRRWRDTLDRLLARRSSVAGSFRGVTATHTDVEEAPGQDGLAATVLESSPVGVIRLDAAGRIVYENPAARELLGVPPDRPSPALGARLSDLPNVQAVGDTAVEELTALVTRGVPLARRRLPFTSIFGRELTITVEGQPIRAPSGAAVGSVIVLADVSREVELEQQLIQAQKMEIFGALVGRVANDLNNILVGVRGHASLLREGLAASSPHRAIIERLDEAAGRLAAVVDGLTALARPGDESDSQALECGQVLREACKLLSGLLPPQVTLTLTSEGPLWSRVGRAHLQQVFVNLCVNARDGILSTGREEGHIRAWIERSIDPEPHVALVVADDGIGMDEATRERVFDPLFTTKPTGEGTGLGLPVSLGIVRSYGGTIEVESQPGLGTTFTVRLPLCDPPPDEALPTVDEAVGPTPRTPRILVVEDHDVVRGLCVQVLESSGYEVVVAASGAEALTAAAQDRFDLALVDVGLPDIDGIRVAEQLGDVPILLTSGNPPEALARVMDHAGARWRFLKKPYDIPDLLDALSEMARPEY